MDTRSYAQEEQEMAHLGEELKVNASGASCKAALAQSQREWMGRSD